MLPDGLLAPRERQGEGPGKPHGVSLRGLLNTLQAWSLGTSEGRSHCFKGLWGFLRLDGFGVSFTPQPQPTLEAEIHPDKSDGLGGSVFQPWQPCILESLAEQVFLPAALSVVE